MKYHKKLNCILHSDVYEPLLHLREGGGGIYSGRLKYNVLKKNSSPILL
jgi:hypothetical protein